MTDQASQSQLPSGESPPPQMQGFLLYHTYNIIDWWM